MNHQNTQKFSLCKLLYSTVCLALCLLLPFLTGQIPQAVKALSSMHIPVLLGGFICGPWWAALVGLIALPGIALHLLLIPPSSWPCKKPESCKNQKHQSQNLKKHKNQKR